MKLHKFAWGYMKVNEVKDESWVKSQQKCIKSQQKYIKSQQKCIKSQQMITGRSA